jgi:hypothetical protein
VRSNRLRAAEGVKREGVRKKVRDGQQKNGRDWGGATDKNSKYILPKVRSTEEGAIVKKYKKDQKSSARKVKKRHLLRVERLRAASNRARTSAYPARSTRCT